jgi:hypothetical protein
LELYGPTGNLVGTAGTSGAYTAQLDRTLASAGTYTVVLRDIANVNTGAYALTWQKPGCP